MPETIKITKRNYKLLHHFDRGVSKIDPMKIRATSAKAAIRKNVDLIALLYHEYKLPPATLFK